MAIYHLTVKIISRGRGQSVVAAAAYRFGVKLKDERYGLTHQYPGNRGLVHAEIVAPTGAPGWVLDRQTLWNRVEAGEGRKDAQLARLIEIGLPLELSADQQIALVRHYVATEFVSKGMIGDFCIRADPPNPHAHILLTMRRVRQPDFGPKERSWNGKSTLLQWRSAWADRANEHLARAGHSVRIDHRTLEAQHIELVPGRKLGIGPERHGDASLPSYLSERISEQQRVAHGNGETILEDPSVVLRALTHQRPSFTSADLAQFLRFRTRGAAQFDAVYFAVMHSEELVALHSDTPGQDRFTSRDMIEAERSLVRRAASMAGRRGHGVVEARQNSAAVQFSLDQLQRRAFTYLVADGDAKAIAVTAGPMKATLLAAVRHASESEGLAVTGAALSDRRAAELQAASGLRASSLAHREAEWAEGRDVLTRASVLLIDGTEMIGLRHLERVVAAADKARAKIVLIADAEQLRAMRVNSPFQTVLSHVGPAD